MSQVQDWEILVWTMKGFQLDDESCGHAVPVISLDDPVSSGQGLWLLIPVEFS